MLGKGVPSPWENSVVLVIPRQKLGSKALDLLTAEFDLILTGCTIAALGRTRNATAFPSLGAAPQGQGLSHHTVNLSSACTR